jgi:carbamoyl-phosphate synthase large subunit
MNGKRVFVSGGAGVIGREIVPRLLALGATVLVGDLKPRPAAFPAGVIYRMGDLNQMTEAELRAFAPNIFIHLAATFERSVESYEFWEENFLHNVRLSHHLMSLAKDAPSLKRVVFASSYLIYDPALYQFETPQDEAVSLRECDPVLPRNLTGMAKFAHEIELRFVNAFSSNRFTTVSARIYRGYGRNSRDVISRWVRSLLRGDPITVFRPEGRFDYVYAADAAEGLIRLASSPSVTGIINLGTGKARRVQDVVDILKAHFPAMRAGSTDAAIPFEASQADMTRFRLEVGWEPVYTLERAVPEIIEFERNEATHSRSAPIGKVLVSSASGKIPLVLAMGQAIRQIAPHGRVVAGDLNPDAISAFVAEEFWAMPPTIDASLDQIVAGLQLRGITCVLPSRDGELQFWARHAARLKEVGVDVIVAPSKVLERCLDKLAFARFGAENDLPFIQASLCIDEIEATRFVVKERYGAGSRSVGIDLPRTAACAHADKLDQPLFQPFVTGTEISIDAWLDRDSHLKGLVLRRRDRIVNGESQVSTTFSDPRIESDASGILEVLKLTGAGGDARDRGRRRATAGHRMQSAFWRREHNEYRGRSDQPPLVSTGGLRRRPPGLAVPSYSRPGPPDTRPARHLCR